MGKFEVDPVIRKWCRVGPRTFAKVVLPLINRFGDEVKEIRVSLGKTSIAGHTAVTGKTFNIVNVYDSEELKKLDPALKFDENWDLMLRRIGSRWLPGA